MPRIPNEAANFSGFLHARDGHLVDGNGSRRVLRGVGLGNWLLPEGYMWRFGQTGPQSPREIEALITDVVGADRAADFWTSFRESFITEADIQLIAAEGLDHVRLPINSRLVIRDDGTIIEAGMALVDQVIEWCRRHQVWVILDLHGAPGGQVGTNIDDSPNRLPELFFEKRHQDLTVTLWKHLAERYRDETVVAGYDLLNEPLPNEYQHKYADDLVALYLRITHAIREVDPNHLIIYEGTHWSTNWDIFSRVWDTNSMLQFHKYWSAPDRASIQRFIQSGERLGLPIYAGEVGENNLEWLHMTFQLFEDCGISWNLWTWKKIDSFTSPLSVVAPPGWYDIVDYAAGTRTAPAPDAAQATLRALIDAFDATRCSYRPEVISAVLQRVPFRISAAAFGHRGVGISHGTTMAAPSRGTFRRADAVAVSTPDLDVNAEIDWSHSDGSPRTSPQRLLLCLDRGDWVTYDAVTTRTANLVVCIDLADAEVGDRTVCLAVQLDGIELAVVRAGDRLEARTTSPVTVGIHMVRVLGADASPPTQLLQIQIHYETPWPIREPAHEPDSAASVRRSSSLEKSQRHLLQSTANGRAGGVVVIGEPELDPDGYARVPESLPTLSAWPKVESLIKPDPAMEALITEMVAKMTVAEKVGQMTQPEISAITPAQVNEHHIGSVLNGGGAWPNADKNATAQDWLELADAYWEASLTSNSATRVPVMWGIDAVHGNNNILGATLFPHNIGLGAAHDPGLARAIGAATAKGVRATGQDWVFAPTVAVVRDDRWGRTYEGFSEDPRITRAYGYEAVIGLQGGDPAGIGPDGVIATAKHFMGDGGTDQGKDQGVTMASEADMINIHGQGYYSAIAAGAQTVMASFSSWTNEELGITEGKVHGSAYLLTEVLKNQLGFDGLVVGDWNGHGQVDGCSNESSPRAINAGIDVVMVPHDWLAFIRNTIAQVESGEIPMARIDDAVSRILRVKLRAGIFAQPKPSERAHAARVDALVHRELARDAVRKSLVLLKNNDTVLPLPMGTRVLVVGKSADSLQNQCGGWTLTWQGTANTNADFPTGTTILGGIQATLGASNVTFDETAENSDPRQFDAVIAVIGETPYAEGVGDLGRRSLENAKAHPEDIEVLDRVSGQGTPVITVLLSGRPLHVNKELNRSDAFVCAWLPGSEGAGVADMLVAGDYTFTGKLSYSWPKEACQTSLNFGDEGYDPLFPLGYGLTKGETGLVGVLDESAPSAGCIGLSGASAGVPLELFNRTDIEPWVAYVGAPDNGSVKIGADLNAVITEGSISVCVADINVQQDARRVTWAGDGPARFFLENPAGGSDLSGYLNSASAVVFDVIVHQPPSARTMLGIHCQWPSGSEVPVTEILRRLPRGVKSTVKIPLTCLDGAGSLEFEKVITPFVIHTAGTFDASFANIRWEPGAADDSDTVRCQDLK